MSSLRWNVVANFLGVGSAAVVQLVCVPFWVGLMGVESYALVGFFLTLQASLAVLDLGLSPTVSRELARGATEPTRRAELRRLFRTFEVFSWACGLGLGALVSVLAPVIARSWLGASALGAEQVVGAVRLMGPLLALQWPVSLYAAALQGLERQGPLNVVRGVVNVAGGAGSIAALGLVAPRIEVFLAWQVFVAAVQLALLAALVWRTLPSSSHRTRVELSLVKPLLGFASGLGGITVFGVLLTQMDKVVLSRLLTLEQFGHYVLATTIVNGLQLFIRPVFSAFFPRLSALMVRGDEREVAAVYHQGTQVMAVLVLPAALVLALWPGAVVWMWTGNEQLVASAGPLVSALVLGTALNGLMHLPYALQLAAGWTRIGLVITVVMVVTLLPLMVALVPERGAAAAAWIWTGLNVAYLCVGVPWTHTRLLRGAAPRWLLRDVGGPLLASLGVLLGARAVVATPGGRWEVAGLLVVAGLAATAAALWAAPRVRAFLAAR